MAHARPVEGWLDLGLLIAWTSGAFRPARSRRESLVWGFAGLRSRQQRVGSDSRAMDDLRADLVKRAGKRRGKGAENHDAGVADGYKLLAIAEERAGAKAIGELDAWSKGFVRGGVPQAERAIG